MAEAFVQSVKAQMITVNQRFHQQFHLPVHGIKPLMPPAFIKENKRMLAKTCLLKTDKGVLWEAKIVREKCDVLGTVLGDKYLRNSAVNRKKRTRTRTRKEREREREREREIEEGEEEEEEDITPPRKSKKYESHSIDLFDYYAREEEDITPPRKSKKRKRHSSDLFDIHARECNDLSSGSKD
ncbi:hypothetical protein HAX54_026558 [Datura stramonium]|uniref:Uncharacterized protein n=1 Tax=Datura stramonium TaxID=4076 RepID=A0ABS8V2Q7_DATST|nr:hypothetical protein [Datura stramonium]